MAGLAEHLISLHEEEVRRRAEEAKAARVRLDERQDRARKLAACAAERLVLGGECADVLIRPENVTPHRGGYLVRVWLDDVLLEWEGTPEGSGSGYRSEEGGLRCLGVQVADLADIARVLHRRREQQQQVRDEELQP